MSASKPLLEGWLWVSTLLITTMNFEKAVHLCFAGKAYCRARRRLWPRWPCICSTWCKCAAHRPAKCDSTLPYKHVSTVASLDSVHAAKLCAVVLHASLADTAGELSSAFARQHTCTLACLCVSHRVQRTLSLTRKLTALPNMNAGYAESAGQEYCWQSSCHLSWRRLSSVC